jgi:hypothetical protein
MDLSLSGQLVIIGVVTMPRDPGPMFKLRPRLRPLTIVVLLITLVLGVVLTVRHGQDLVAGWYGAVPIYPGALQIGLLLAVLAAYGIGVRVLYPLQGRRGAGLLVAWSVAGSVSVTLAVLALTGKPLGLLLACVSSRGCTGGYAMSLALTPETLAAWPRLMPTWWETYTHLATQAPGWPLLYRAVSQTLEQAPVLSAPLAAALRPLRCSQWSFLALSDSQLASAWLGLAAPLWAGLTAIPLYCLGRATAGEETARIGVSWWPLLPAPAIFAATQSNVYALLATTTVALFWAGLVTRRGWLAALLLGLAGAVIGTSLFLNFSLTPILMLCGLLALALSVQQYGLRLWSIIRHAVLIMIPFGLGFLLIWGLFWRTVGLSPVELFIVAMQHQTSVEWGYLSGVLRQAWDFALFAGLPVIGLALAPLVDRRLRPVTSLAAATGLTILAVLFSGTGRGELGRVWIFFMPLVLLAGAGSLQRMRRSERRLLVAAQVILVLALTATFDPVNTRLPAPPVYASVATPALNAPLVPAAATFGGMLRLVGYQAEYDRTGSALNVALHWQALRPMKRPYYFSAILVAPDGRARQAHDWQPFAERFPTTCWASTPAAETIVDRVTLPLAPEALAGDWWLSLSVFDIEQGQRAATLPVSLFGGGQDTQVGLGPLTVTP